LNSKSVKRSAESRAAVSVNAPAPPPPAPRAPEDRFAKFQAMKKRRASACIDDRKTPGGTAKAAAELIPVEVVPKLGNSILKKVHESGLPSGPQHDPEDVSAFSKFRALKKRRQSACIDDRVTPGGTAAALATTETETKLAAEYPELNDAFQASSDRKAAMYAKANAALEAAKSNSGVEESDTTKIAPAPVAPPSRKPSGSFAKFQALKKRRESACIDDRVIPGGTAAKLNSSAEDHHRDTCVISPPRASQRDNIGMFNKFQTDKKHRASLAPALPEVSYDVVPQRAGNGVITPQHRVSVKELRSIFEAGGPTKALLDGDMSAAPTGSRYSQQFSPSFGQLAYSNRASAMRLSPSDTLSYCRSTRASISRERLPSVTKAQDRSVNRQSGQSAADLSDAPSIVEDLEMHVKLSPTGKKTRKSRRKTLSRRRSAARKAAKKAGVSSKRHSMLVQSSKSKKGKRRSVNITVKVNTVPTRRRRSIRRSKRRRT
jgi:hypothetical protein